MQVQEDTAVAAGVVRIIRVVCIVRSVPPSQPRSHSLFLTHSFTAELQDLTLSATSLTVPPLKGVLRPVLGTSAGQNQEHRQHTPTPTVSICGYYPMSLWLPCDLLSYAGPASATATV
jgi:hypothetical protein